MGSMVHPSLSIYRFNTHVELHFHSGEKLYCNFLTGEVPSGAMHMNVIVSVCVCVVVCDVCICSQLVYLPTGTGRVLILMAPPSPRLACNNEDSTFNNLDRQIKTGIQ